MEFGPGPQARTGPFLGLSWKGDEVLGRGDAATHARVEELVPRRMVYTPAARGGERRRWAGQRSGSLVQSAAAVIVVAAGPDAGCPWPGCRARMLAPGFAGPGAGSAST